jgi:hypothetical protein
MDFYFANHGSVSLLTPLTDAAKDWIDEHLTVEPWQRLGNGIAIEPRYAGLILIDLEADGLTVGV